MRRGDEGDGLVPPPSSAMGKETIAEFVETQEIIDALKEIGVDSFGRSAQGRDVERPKPLQNLFDT